MHARPLGPTKLTKLVVCFGFGLDNSRARVRVRSGGGSARLLSMQWRLVCPFCRAAKTDWLREDRHFPKHTEKCDFSMFTVHRRYFAEHDNVFTKFRFGVLFRCISGKSSQSDSLLLEKQALRPLGLVCVNTNMLRLGTIICVAKPWETGILSRARSKDKTLLR